MTVSGRFESVRVQKAATAAVEAIRKAIIDGDLRPGQRLKEDELARELGISRTPVREALLALSAEGLVRTSPNKGATVAVHAAEDFDDLYQLRAVLEGYAARRAASRLRDVDLSILRESCERFESIADGDIRALVDENMLFHTTVLDGAASPRLSHAARQVIEMPLVYKAYIWHTPDQKLISSHSHRQLVKALEDRDGERAEMIMREHILEARDLLVERALALSVEADSERLKEPT